MNAIRLRGFRCFRDEQKVRLAPLTLLVGENSTGKTSFLALIRALWDIGYRHELPDFKEAPLMAEASCQSNDEHVLALARVSGARLLYSRDEALRKDFQNRQLIADPRGKIYPETLGGRCRQWLQRQRDLCAT